MRETLTLRLNPDVVKAAKRKAQADNRTLTNYIETLMIRDLQGGSSLQVIAPPDIRERRRPMRRPHFARASQRN